MHELYIVHARIVWSSYNKT